MSSNHDEIIHPSIERVIKWVKCTRPYGYENFLAWIDNSRVQGQICVSFLLTNIAQNGYVEIIIKLLHECANDLSTMDYIIALRGACISGHYGIVKNLIELKLGKLKSQKYKNHIGTALAIAAKFGYKAIVEFLIPYSNPKINDSLALKNAIILGDIDIINMLIPYSNFDHNFWGSEAVYMAIESNRIDIIKLLLANKPKGNIIGAAIWHAARNGNKEIIKLFLPYSNREINSNALFYASEYGFTDIVKLLIPLSNPSAYNSGAIRIANIRNHLDIVELLIPVSKSPIGYSFEYMLDGIIKKGNKHLAKVLIPYCTNKKQNSIALRTAFFYGYHDLVDLLVPISDKEVVHELGLDFIQTKSKK